MNVKWVPKGKFRCAGTHIKPQFHVEERGASQTKSAARKCTATLRGFARGGAHAAGRIEIFLVGRMQLVEARGPKVPAIVPRNLSSHTVPKSRSSCKSHNHFLCISVVRKLRSSGKIGKLSGNRNAECRPLLTWGSCNNRICTRRAGKLYSFRLPWHQSLQVNTRL